MKSKKFIIISVISVIIFSLIFGAIYFNTHYAVIDKKIYRNDIKQIRLYSLDNKNIKKINKFNEIESMILSGASENSVSKFKNFPNLNHLMIMSSQISSSDSEKISDFNSLKELIIDRTNANLKNFKNDTVSTILLLLSDVTDIESLDKCSSLKTLIIDGTTISDNCIVVEDGTYILKDSSVFTSFDYVNKLQLGIDEIQDISGILEMDSLKVFEVNKGAISEDDKKLLEDKGISVIENE